MNITFTTNHMQTLTELKILAEKHNCTITFGVDSISDNIIDDGILAEHGFTEDLRNEIHKRMIIEDCRCSSGRVWFELYDKNTEKHNVMSYIDSSTLFYIKRDEYYDFCEEGPSEELLAKLEEYDEAYDPGCYMIHLRSTPTLIRGFGVGPIRDNRVYRFGMALKFFGDLVCDYLNEPRIERVY